MTSLEKDRIIGTLVREQEVVKQDLAVLQQKALELSKVLSKVSVELYRITRYPSDPNPPNPSVFEAGFNIGEASEIFHAILERSGELESMKAKLKELGINS